MSHLFSQESYPKYTSILGNLWLIGMPLFFVLSGFLMTYNYTAQFQSSWFLTAWKFYVARIARIYPVYLLALFLALSFVGGFFHELKERPVDVCRSMERVLTLTQSWSNAMVFQGHSQERPLALAYNGVGWSVSVEAFFYLLFPLIVLFVPWKMNRVWKVVVCAVGVFSLFVYLNHLCVKRLDPSMNIIACGTLRGWLVYLSPYMRFGEFLLGCLAGQLYRLTAASTPGRWEQLVGHAVLWSSIICLVRFTIYPPDWSTPTLKNHLQFNNGYAPFCAAIIFCLARYPSLLRQFLAFPLLVLLGEASYGMYLTQPLLQGLFIPRLLGETDLQHWQIIVYNNLAMVVCPHLFCLGLYQFAEVPMRRVLRNLLGPRDASKRNLPPRDQAPESKMARVLRSWLSPRKPLTVTHSTPASVQESKPFAA